MALIDLSSVTPVFVKRANTGMNNNSSTCNILQHIVNLII
ncbi:hypothetical protein CLHUN_12840 [Ruminiclostridium hungatei]|uniref:Uncharacterized protein n=1 Tax=Ruminiclostridium hungatei TaxID=48256 RepID=A0A1V4SMD6_RUMHU|nr:hypothetical protein CLHUN_12840 [Ruminiclostridium hungatei]